MKITGDIKVWVDDQRACARLTAEGKEGPIVVQACAPLSVVRKRVRRMLEERGHQVSGHHPGFEAIVSGVARSTALHRLERLAPALFVPGGVATYLALRELQRRRDAQGRARRERDEAMKSLGPEDDEYGDEDDYEDEGGDEIVGWRRRHRHHGAHIGAGASDAALAVASTTPQVQAGVSLLRLARRNRRARRKVTTIVVRAQEGDPRAQAQLRTLRVAKRVESARARKALPAQRTPLALPAPMASSPLPTSLAPSARRRGGLFHPWDPEMIRRRGA